MSPAQVLYLWTLGSLTAWNLFCGVALLAGGLCFQDRRAVLLAFAFGALVFVSSQVSAIWPNDKNVSYLSLAFMAAGWVLAIAGAVSLAMGG